MADGWWLVAGGWWLVAGGWWDAGIWIDGGHDNSIRNNIITDNLGPVIQVSDADLQYYNQPQATYNYIIENNTMAGNYWNLYSYNFGQCPLPPTEILDWKDTNSSGTAIGFSGTMDTEFEESANYDFLCIKWPCGVETACTQD